MGLGSPEPWLRKGRGWYVTIDGKQVSLRTRDKSEAMRRWHALMARSSPTCSLDDDPLVVELLALFCDWAERHLAPRTYGWYRHYLHSFVRFAPHGLTLSALKPIHVTAWLDNRSRWGDSSRRAAITAVKRALHWAEEQGVIERSPLAHLKRPAAPRRTSTLTAEHKTLILKSVSDERFRELLVAAELTGCRPQEVCRVEARHFDAEKGTWVFPTHENKTGAKTGRPRVVYLPPALISLSARLAEARPNGPLFRNRSGKPWTANAIRYRFKRLKAKLAGQVPDDLCLYLYRHTFATDALENGLNPVTVAELLGHSDAATLSRVYQHLADRHDHMSQAVIRATSGSAS